MMVLGMLFFFLLLRSDYAVFYFYDAFLIEIVCLMLKITRCGVGSIKVISARAITGVHAGRFIKIYKQYVFFR